MKGMELLGLRVRDMVIGTEGIVTSISYDLYGCIQAIITPSIDAKNRNDVNGWYDIKRLEILDYVPLMDIPDWDDEAIGCADKPTL